MSERLLTMVDLLLKQVTLRDEFGRLFVLTGFKDNGRVALLSRQGGPPSMPMEVTRLDGLEVVNNVGFD